MEMLNQVKELIDYWNSLLKPLSNNKVLVEDKELGIKTKIDIINGNLEDFKRFWNLLITPGYVGFYSKDFLEFLSKKKEWKFFVTKNIEDLFNLPADIIFFLIKVGDNVVNKGEFNLDKLNKIEERLKKEGKEVMYYIVKNYQKLEIFKIYLLH